MRAITWLLVVAQCRSESCPVDVAQFKLALKPASCHELPTLRCPGCGGPMETRS